MYINLILIFTAQIALLLNMELIYLFTKLSQYCFSYAIIFNIFTFLFIFIFLKTNLINEKAIFLLPLTFGIGLFTGILSHYLSGIYFKRYQVDYADLLFSRDYMTIFLTSWGWAIFPLLIVPIKNLKKTFCSKEDRNTA